MQFYYLQRAFEILREDGFKALCQSSTNFLIRNVLSDNNLFRIHTTKNRYLNELKYNCLPYHVIHVSPRQGERIANSISKSKGLGQIVGGDWDQNENTILLSESYEYQGVIQRFGEGIDWKNTVYYKKAKQKIENNGSIAGYTDLDKFLNIRCAYVDDLFDKIREEGYRPNYRGDHDVPEIDTRAREKRYRHELEPLICIGRNGRIFWVEGLHRLAISRVLGIEKIPVQVIVRHKQWQELRDNIYNNGLPEGREDLHDHPDLHDILD